MEGAGRTGLEVAALMAFLSEAQLEAALLTQLSGLGYACASDELVGPDGKQPERDAYDEVVLKSRLTTAVARLYPTLPPARQTDAMRRLTQSELPNLLEETCRLQRLRTEGEDAEYFAEDGTLTADAVVRTINADEGQSISLAQLRNALLPKLISGELRIADTERFVEARA